MQESTSCGRSPRREARSEGIGPHDRATSFLLSAEEEPPEQLGAHLHLIPGDMGDHPAMIALPNTGPHFPSFATRHARTQRTTDDTTMTKAPTGNAAAKHKNKRTYRSPPVTFPPATGRVLIQFSSVQFSSRAARTRP